MRNQMHEPVDILRQSLYGERPVDEDVVSSVTKLADKLNRLKQLSPLFESVGFSPTVEAMAARDMAVTAG